MRPVILLGTVFLLACGVGDGRDSAEMEEAGRAPVAEAPSAPPAAASQPMPDAAPVPAPAERKIVRNAQLSLVVTSPPAAADRLVRMADSLGGYASDLRAERRDELLHYWIVLRLPAARLDAALSAIKALAVSVENEAIQAEDVTDQVVDLVARLTTLEATEAELQALLAESRSRRADVEEIMTVYRELTGIRTQIEQLRAQLQTVESRVALSTITIELRPEAGSGPLVSDRWRPGGTARSAVRALVDVLQGLVEVGIYAVIVVLPILAILAAPFVVAFLLLRRRFRKRTAV